MKKYLIGILLVLLLSACGPSSQPLEDQAEISSNNNPPTTNATDMPEEAEAAKPTEEVTAPEPTDTEEVESEEDEPETETAVSAPAFKPATSFTEAAELRETDYTRGAEEPIVAIIEYGDFQ